MTPIAPHLTKNGKWCFGEVLLTTLPTGESIWRVPVSCANRPVDNSYGLVVELAEGVLVRFGLNYTHDVMLEGDRIMWTTPSGWTGERISAILELCRAWSPYEWSRYKRCCDMDQPICCGCI